MRYSSVTRPSGNAPAAGILVANIGSPAAPTPNAVRAYLRLFLADPRVVELPRFSWWLLRNLVVLPFRPRRSAELYRRIWTPQGSPLLVTNSHQVTDLEEELTRRHGERLPVELGMAYGRPFIAQALRTLRQSGCTKILVLPLFPQYSGTTTASVFDAVARELSTWRRVPELRFITGYHDHPAYIEALAAGVEQTWREGGKPARMLLSFHGLPVRYVEAGDPYPEQCRATAALLTEALEIDPECVVTGFQSRFGREPWLEPATDALLRAWGAEGLAGLDVLCPGFAADCLETLEEIALTGRETFELAGGRRFRYLPALNDRPHHIAALADIVDRHLAGWLD